MKRFLFIMIFASAISFFGISKASALPIGSVFENWETNKRELGFISNNNGAYLPLYGYDGSGMYHCPYLDITDETAPLACYGGMTNPSGGNSFTTSLLVNSYPLCTSGDCIASSSLDNLTILLYNDIYSGDLFFFETGKPYHLEILIGVNSDYINTFYNFLLRGTNYQNSTGTISNVVNECYLANNPANKFGTPYCKVSFDYVPFDRAFAFYVDFSQGIPLAELNAYLEWILYPSVTEDVISQSDKYTMKSNQYAFISGIKTGSVYMPEKYWFIDGSYLNYYDINRDSQPYKSYINDYNFTNDGEYLIYNYDINSFSGSELVMLSTNAWSTIYQTFPHKYIDFYVPKNAYVDIVDFKSVSDVGNTLTFKYKDADTGVIRDVIVNSFSLDSSSGTLFGYINSGLDIFKDGILNVGTIFSTFFNSLNSPFAWFIILVFSFVVLAGIIKLLM